MTEIYSLEKIINERKRESASKIVIDSNVELKSGMILEVRGIKSNKELKGLFDKFEKEFRGTSNTRILICNMLQNIDIIDTIGKTLFVEFDSNSTIDMNKLQIFHNKNINVMEMERESLLTDYVLDNFDLYIFITDKYAYAGYIRKLLNKNKKVIITSNVLDTNPVYTGIKEHVSSGKIKLDGNNCFYSLCNNIKTGVK